VAWASRRAWANAHRIPVEAEKAKADQGHYLHPELFEHAGDQSIAELHHPRPKQRQQNLQRAGDGGLLRLHGFHRSAVPPEPQQWHGTQDNSHARRTGQRRRSSSAVRRSLPGILNVGTSMILISQKAKSTMRTFRNNSVRQRLYENSRARGSNLL
jgi:hypothetical protein